MVSNRPVLNLFGDWAGMSGLRSYCSPVSLEFELSAAREALREPSFNGCRVSSGECIRKPFNSAVTADGPRN